jgi:hypothetical protein
MNIRKNLPKINITIFFFSVFFSLCMSLAAYLYFLQSPILSKREIFFTALIFIFLIPSSYILLNRFIFPRILTYPPKRRILLVLLSILFGIFIVLITNQPKVYFLLPRHSLTIQVPVSADSSGGDRVVAITGFSNGWEDVSFSQFRQTGSWKRESNRIYHVGSSPASLQWTGRVNTIPAIIFEKSPNAGSIDVIWDGQATNIFLSGNVGESETISTVLGDNQGYLFQSVPYIIIASFLFLWITILLLEIKINQKRDSSPLPKYSWLFYTLPMVVVWGIYLLTFFPGMMSPDSNVQWGQIISGHFNDAHPVFHTLSMWLVTRIWLSPAAVVISQILFLSLTVAWGIRLLEEHGFPAWAGWLLAAIFALAPLNGNMVIVLWKDIPYSTSLFLLSLMILKIVLTKGDWLEKQFTWVWLGLVSMCIASFRHNGFPIPIAAWIALLIFYRNWWKYIVRAAVMSLVVYGVIHGPIYKALMVEQPTSGTFEHILMHHIAAHINTGQPLTPSEQSLAESIVPGSNWGYNCCSALSTSKTTGLFDAETSIPDAAVQELFISLAVKEPGVELEHLKCVSSIVWRSPGYCGANTLLPYNSTLWIDPGAKENIENSLIPAFQQPLSNFLIDLRTKPSLTLINSPAVYLWFGIYATVIFSFRSKNWKGLLYILPIVVQSATYLLINVSDQFRYHYAAYLVGLFGVGLLILSLLRTDSNESDKALGIPPFS